MCGSPVETDLIDRAEDMPVLSVHMPVLAATDIVVTKLMALDEHYCDFARMLPVARALREQVDWARVQRGHGGQRLRRRLPRPAGPSRHRGRPDGAEGATP